MVPSRCASAVVLLFLCLSPGLAHLSAAEQPHPFENEIRAFEAADRTNPPPQNAILFIGSSSIRLWKTMAEDFKGYEVINRGFGGSQTGDAVFYADQIVLPYHPKQIYFYAGDNDLAAGKSPEDVLANFQAFTAKVFAALPETRIVYISIKPSPSRWRLAAEMRRGNDLIARFCKTDSRLGFVNVFDLMLDHEGRPQDDLFVADKLHMNRKGYDLWTSAIKPTLPQKQP